MSIGPFMFWTLDGMKYCKQNYFEVEISSIENFLLLLRFLFSGIDEWYQLPINFFSTNILIS